MKRLSSISAMLFSGTFFGLQNLIRHITTYNLVTHQAGVTIEKFPRCPSAFRESALLQ